MATIGQINQTLDESVSLKYITQAYSEIAAVKLQKIRSGIEKNRNFFQEISQVFRMVQVAAHKRNVDSKKTAQKGTISILLTSNERFNGNLENQLTRFFVVNTTKFPTDRVVIGRTAMDFLKTMRYAHEYKSFILEEDLPSYQELRGLIDGLMGYEQILVYYSRMQSVLIQEPHVVDVLQRPTEHYQSSTGRTLDYIFEPELAKMIQFFNSQVATLLFEQTFLESELARTAARLISMDQAQTNADELIKKQRTLLAFAKRSTDNIRLLDTIACLQNIRKERGS